MTGTPLININRRKFRSQTSDNMEKWKSRGGKSQRREVQKREDQRRERVRREKVGKSRFHCVFPMICGSEGFLFLGSRRVRSHLARWEMEHCTPLWHEAHFQVKMYKTHHVRTTSVVTLKKIENFGFRPIQFIYIYLSSIKSNPHPNYCKKQFLIHVLGCSVQIPSRVG
jgi:hypothetical protein